MVVVATRIEATNVVVSDQRGPGVSIDTSPLDCTPGRYLADPSAWITPPKD